MILIQIKTKGEILEMFDFSSGIKKKKLLGIFKLEVDVAIHEGSYYTSQQGKKVYIERIFRVEYLEGIIYAEGRLEE